MRTTGWIAGFLLLAPGGHLDGQQLREEHRVVLREGFRLMAAVSDRWPGWGTAPDAVLFVDGDVEFLIGHPDPSDDFRVAAGTPLAGRTVLVRNRVMSPGVLATFPVSGVPTVVIGTPEATGLSPTRWIFTLLHEHFHQLQMSSPGYFAGVDALDLSGGDETGMWMLNYPFPYTDPSVAEAVADAGRAARDLAETARAGPVSDEALGEYLEIRTGLERSTPANALRYLAFQLWQEGVARYAELDAAVHAAGTYTVSDDFRSLPGYAPLDEAAEELWAQIRSGVEAAPEERGRVYFYGLGALEAVILEAVRPDWRGRYLREPFDLTRYWDTPATPDFGRAHPMTPSSLSSVGGRTPK